LRAGLARVGKFGNGGDREEAGKPSSPRNEASSTSARPPAPDPKTRIDATPAPGLRRDLALGRGCGCFAALKNVSPLSHSFRSERWPSRVRRARQLARSTRFPTRSRALFGNDPRRVFEPYRAFDYCERPRARRDLHEPKHATPRHCSGPQRQPDGLLPVPIRKGYWRPTRFHPYRPRASKSQ
jgi:hypothetical protein